MVNLAIFASGNGSNVESIQKYIKSRKLDNEDREDSIRIKMVFINNKNAYIVNRCKELGLSYIIIDDKYLKTKLLSKLEELNIQLIALCGFLRKIPKEICDNYKIVNIHPSLLPKYGGKGMYGMNVHKEVIRNKERYTGITIHYVNENYDDGDIIWKVKIKVTKNDTPETIANKIKCIEHKWYPVIIYSLI